jgi:GH24 family phage-related lysozyme (muramidase)
MFVFNLGPGNFRGSSLLQNLNSGQPVVEHNFTDYALATNKATGVKEYVPGLFDRRGEEYSIFNTGHGNSRCN